MKIASAFFGVLGDIAKEIWPFIALAGMLAALGFGGYFFWIGITTGPLIFISLIAVIILFNLVNR